MLGNVLGTSLWCEEIQAWQPSWVSCLKTFPALWPWSVAVEGTGWPGNFLKKTAQGNIGIVCSQVTGILPPAEVAACTPLGAVSKAIWPSHS